MRIVIIEDESKAGNHLLKLLKECEPSISCDAILESVEDATIWFKNNNDPDLIMMDIQLGDGLSFELFQNVEIKAPIIFTTAFDKYAIEAFKVNSVDYLLKPINKSELLNALEKFKEFRIKDVNLDLISALLQELTGNRQKSAFLVKDGSGFIRLPADEIDYFYSEDSLSFAVRSGKRYILDKTLDQICVRINNNSFFRINRSQVVAMNKIVKIEPYFNHRLILTISSTKDVKFIVSRAKVGAFKTWIEI